MFCFSFSTVLPPNTSTYQKLKDLTNAEEMHYLLGKFKTRPTFWFSFFSQRALGENIAHP
jgi:hypothetical protein